MKKELNRSMKVKFYGVRGSVPSPCASKVGFGGNTSCVKITGFDETKIILDSGTGIIKLGEELIEESTDDINILLTHNHWDHIQGFPFFKPIYQSGRKIKIFPGQVDSSDKDAILTQMSGSNFPVKYDQLPASISLDKEATASKGFTIGNFDVQTQALNHPDGGTAYLISQAGKKVAYVTDNELFPPGKINTSIKEWETFIDGADLLIHDGQFVDTELPEKLGWGHSTTTQVLKLAKSANVKAVALISHDPFRTDEQLEQIEKELKEDSRGFLQVCCAKEGQLIDLSAIEF